MLCLHPCNGTWARKIHSSRMQTLHNLMNQTRSDRTLKATQSTSKPTIYRQLNESEEIILDEWSFSLAEEVTGGCGMLINSHCPVQRFDFYLVCLSSEKGKKRNWHRETGSPFHTYSKSKTVKVPPTQSNLVMLQSLMRFVDGRQWLWRIAPSMIIQSTHLGNLPELAKISISG